MIGQIEDGLDAVQTSGTKQVAMQIEEQELTIKIVRETGTGLGISIAGGKGSTPYRGNDEVRYARKYRSVVL